MRLVALVFGFLAFACGSSATSTSRPPPRNEAQLEAKGPFLWRVDGSGGPLFLYGTIHTGGETVIPALAFETLATAKTFVMETDIDNVDQALIVKRAVITSGPTLDQQLGPESWSKLVAAIGTSIPVAALPKFKPWLAMVLVTKEMTGTSEATDVVLRARAKERQLTLEYLESVESQLDALEVVMTLETLRAMLDDLPLTKSTLDALLQAYREGDAAKLEKLMYAGPTTPEMHDRMFKRRNLAWMPALEKLAVTGHAFVAVGAGHLVGPDGVVALLRAKGYKVTRVAGALAALSDRTEPRTGSDKLKGPDPEHGNLQSKVVLPAVPAFELPVAPAGTHGVRELLVAGKQLFGTELKVSGYVTWIYDCLSAVRRPGQSLAKTQKLIDDDPTICERAKFYLGDTKDTPYEQSLWVVDVPRQFNKLELERITKADRASYPDRCEPNKQRKNNLCPALAVGDYVTLSGMFTTASPHSERNSDGLFVLTALTPGDPPTTITMKAVAAPAQRAVPALVVTALRKPPASEAARTVSIKSSNAATRTYGQRDYAKALDEYREAIKAWDGNHVAWYGMAGAQIGSADWKAATSSMRKAFELAPSDPMYAMVLGYCLYELAITDARGAGAVPDLSTIDFSEAEKHLRHAVKLDGSLWRAHYYLGRIARDAGRAKEAAEELTLALATAPSQPGPWVALGELYRKWKYTDLALAVAQQGSQIASGQTDVWYVLGMAHDDLRNDGEAIAAFSKALDVDANNAKAKFQRGQAYFRSNKYREAKRDLEAFLAASSPHDFAKQQANKMLLDIAAKQR